MYILTTTAYPHGQHMVYYKWLLLSHTGLVMARSDCYKRHCDATRIGKQVAGRLGIEFRGDL